MKPALVTLRPESEGGAVIEVVVQEYCQNCMEFEPRADISALYANETPAAVHIAVKCVHSQKCKLIKRHLEERAARAEEAGQ